MDEQSIRGLFSKFPQGVYLEAETSASEFAAASTTQAPMMIFAFVLQREIDMLVVRAHDHMHMRMCSSAHQLHFAVSTTPRRARAVEKWPISQIFSIFPSPTLRANGA